MGSKEKVVKQQQVQCPTCPAGTVCEDSDLLCINIPCTTTVVLLGLDSVKYWTSDVSELVRSVT